MKKLTSNCDYPNLILSVIWIVFDIVVLLYYLATTDKVEWRGVGNCLFWTIFPLMFIFGLYKEGSKSE